MSIVYVVLDYGRQENGCSRETLQLCSILTTIVITIIIQIKT